MNRIIIIQGPTASGKSTLAIELAQKINAPIVSADSRQFYKEMSIGTAKPSKNEMHQAKHYFIDTHSINDPSLTSAGYMKLGREQIAKLFHEGASDIVVTGGSGMFIDALIDGLHDSPSDAELRDALHEEWSKNGIETLLKELESKDPESYSTIDTNNPMRVLRALEMIRVSGKTLKEIREIPKDGINYPIQRFVISWKREDLYTRINMRVHQMIDEGLFDEVKELPLKESILLQNTVGYKEWIPYFSEESSYDETISMIQKNSRNYAKRQETWLKRYSDLICLNPYDAVSLKEQLLSYI
tara:strand:+ start:2541 stop:3440 length:900 start_codon:yes stop_codon:yes gene_type:complete